MSQPAVRCAALSKDFGSVHAVNGLDLSLDCGQVLALVGPSGCGKTTVLRLIAGFEVPNAGSIEIGGRVVAGEGVHVPPERRRVGMVFQDYALFPHLSVADNVAYGLRRGPEREPRVKQVLDLAGLAGLESRMPHQLSGGQQQRVALARALAPEPQVLLMDEPFSNLDAGLRAQVRAEVKEIVKASGTTAIFVTHDQEEALFMGDLVAVMNEGHLEQMDTPQDIFHASTTRFVARFMGLADFLPARFSQGRLETEIGSAPIAKGIAPREGLEVMVRPDDVAFRPSATGGGTIVARTFQGAFYLYRVALPSGLTVRCLRPHAEEYAVGTRVEVRLDPGHPLTCFLNGRAATAKPTT